VLKYSIGCTTRVQPHTSTAEVRQDSLACAAEGSTNRRRFCSSRRRPAAPSTRRSAHS
jgi:hypothetical protein